MEGILKKASYQSSTTGLIKNKSKSTRKETKQIHRCRRNGTDGRSHGKVYSCWTNINTCLVNNISTVRNSMGKRESKAPSYTPIPEKSVVYNILSTELKLQTPSIGTSHLNTTQTLGVTAQKQKPALELWLA